MRFTLRFKLLGLVGVAAIALIALTISSAVFEHAVEVQVDSIRDTYLPKIRLRPQLEGAFERLTRTIQNAVEASDADLLTPATAEKASVVQLISTTHDAMTVGQSAALRLAIDDYFDTAIIASRRLIAGEGGETTAAHVQEMQTKRARVAGLISQVTTFDEHALAAAFAATEAEQRTASVVRVIVGAVCLLALFVISWWIGSGLFASLGALIAGFERFGRKDFATRIVATTRDELADVAMQANKMADQLSELDLERARNEWIRNGLAGLGDELRGELEPREVADRTVEYLARYLQTPVGALYYATAGGYELLGRYALAEGTTPASFARGEGLLGQAALRSTITTIELPEAGALALHSGLVSVTPRALILLPLVRGEVTVGILELAAVRPWRALDSELLSIASESIAITLEVAQARSAARLLLDQTQQQASDLERAGVALGQKATELAKASAYKSQFLAGMSHELRTPLNAIIGFTEIMYDRSIPIDAETAHEYLGDVLTSGRHLLQLINDVLDLAKVEAGKVDFHPEPIELTKVVAEVLSVLKTTSSKQQVDITTEIASDVDHLILDSSRLKQVLYNYISNALKFTPPRGHVVVRASAESPDRFRIEVEDTGPGIAADQLGRLFGDFQQTDEGARRNDSTGLGLALTKRLVEAQGGEVGVRSVVGSGSTFYAVLPRQFGIPKAPAMTLEIVRAHTNAPTILVVEDEITDRERLVTALANAGYAVEAVSTGAEAVERCETHEYDAITLDLLLPDMTGLEVLQRLRTGRNDKVPIIVVTVVAERGAVAGYAVHDVLAKPLSEEALLSSLNRAGVRVGHGPSIVLVVDDDIASLKVMAATLNRLGYLAVCEQDPVRGLRVAAEQPPSAIVLDLLMPGMTGFEFLEQLRATPSARGIPVIVWTSKDLTPDERERLRSSAQTVVAKGTEGNARVLAELASALPNHARGRA
ncbi:MAG: response regulator [Kofleriaceae bacterium]